MKELKEILSECMREAGSIEELAERLAASDVVPVVRCMDCKHGQRNNYGQLRGHYICEYHQDGPLKHPAHYCNSGERFDDA